MSSQPLSTTANVNQLERPAMLEGMAYVLQSPDGNACQRDALPSPLILVCEGVSNHVSEAYPRQPVVCLKCAVSILRNQENSLCRFDQNCGPACKWSCEADLHRAHNMARGKLFCCPCVYNEGVSPLFLLKLGCCQLLQL